MYGYNANSQTHSPFAKAKRDRQSLNIIIYSNKEKNG